LRLFRNKTSHLGLGTQTIQWLIMQTDSPGGIRSSG
jgi:hypothetical protein